MLVQPALSFLWDIVFFNRPANLLILLGAVITIGAIYLAVNGQMKLERKHDIGRGTAKNEER